jgi:hypothetical protein
MKPEPIRPKETSVETGGKIGWSQTAPVTDERRGHPTIGRIVYFRLTNEQVDDINSRRTTTASIHDRINGGTWPIGIQAHIGNPNAEKEILPMVITKICPDEFGPGKDGVNGQVFLDGNDSLWVKNVGEGVGPGQWAWPVKV